MNEKEIIEQDAKIWNNNDEYFIEESEFNPTIKTQLPRGTDLTVYSETVREITALYFASKNGVWIRYKNVSS